MSDRRASGTKTTVQRRSGRPLDLTPLATAAARRDDKRAIKHSAFILTINTNISMNDDEAADVMADQLGEVLDEIGYHGAACEVWGPWFKVNTGRGKPFLDKKGKVPNPAYDPDYNAYYAEDDKKGVEHWCSLIESMRFEGAGVEWAPGTRKNRRNQYLHAHVVIRVSHRTRLTMDCDYIATYFQEKMLLPHRPYVHSDYLADNTQRALDYVTKNAWNRNSPELLETVQKVMEGYKS